MHSDVPSGRKEWKPRIRSALDALRGREAPAKAEGETAQVAAPAGKSIDQSIETLAAASTREVQDRGFHFQRRDYYSALNDLPFLAENWDLWHERQSPPGIGWDVDAQLEEVRRISPYFAELANVPFNPPPGPPQYHWENDFWRGSDALIHYGLLRDLKPRRVIEIGAGWSSLLMADALERNREEGSAATIVNQIEPYPRRELLSALPPHWTLHKCILQRANLDLFDSLEAGDVCFFDGSHVARAGSDVVWFFFEVVPRLKPGVVIHVHDIFWPADYPDDWIFERGQTWNEQYVLQAFLMYNSDFVPMVSNSMLSRHRGEALEELFRGVPETHHTGVSVWLKRIAGQPWTPAPSMVSLEP